MNIYITTSESTPYIENSEVINPHFSIAKDLAYELASNIKNKDKIIITSSILFVYALANCQLNFINKKKVCDFPSLINIQFSTIDNNGVIKNINTKYNLLDGQNPLNIAMSNISCDFYEALTYLNKDNK